MKFSFTTERLSEPPKIEDIPQLEPVAVPAMYQDVNLVCLRVSPHLMLQRREVIFLLLDYTSMS